MDRRSHSRRRLGALSLPESPITARKRRRGWPLLLSSGEIAENGSAGEFFDRIPDDLIILVLSKLSSSATCPSDFINALLSCKKAYSVCLHSLVLSKASMKLLVVKAKTWSESAHRFLWRCTIAGNLDACFVLGMIRFYCLGNRVSGVSLIWKAAVRFHPPALFSLAVIQFNGSGGSKKNKNLHAGVTLCARAASHGHLDALREFGHCLQDGYGVRQNVIEGRRCFIQANFNEFVAGKTEPHPVNLFMADWFAERLDALAEVDLRLCSNKVCGRPETRRHEFRRCSMCGDVHYCSRACQVLDWKMSHKMECVRDIVGGLLPNVDRDDDDGGGGGAREEREDRF